MTNRILRTLTAALLALPSATLAQQPEGQPQGVEPTGDVPMAAGWRNRAAGGDQT